MVNSPYSVLRTLGKIANMDLSQSHIHGNVHQTGLLEGRGGVVAMVEVDSNLVVEENLIAWVVAIVAVVDPSLVVGQNLLVRWVD